MKQLALMTRYEVPISYRFSRDVLSILLVFPACLTVSAFSMASSSSWNLSLVSNYLSIVRNREQEWAGMK